MSRIARVLVLLSSLSFAACAHSWSKPLPVSAPGEGGYQVRSVGEHFACEIGNCVMIRVQDEYRLILESSESFRSGMFEQVYAVQRDGIDWTEWLDVKGAPGLKIAFLDPETIAVRYERPQAPR